MDFSYLDKQEYKDIHICDDEYMKSFSNNDKFFIRKYIRNSQGHILHRHKYVQINYVCNGKGYHYINNQKVNISEGDIFIIPPYVPHLILPKEENEIEIYEFEFSTDFILSNGTSDEAECYLDFAYLEPFMVSEEQVKPKFNLDEKTRIKAEEILSETLGEYEEKSPGYILIAKALLLKLLVITGRAYSKEIKGTDTEMILNKYKELVYRSVDYIEKNYAENITLKKISSEINYSPSHFSYLFKAITGKTFVEYLNNLRVEKAIELLENSDKGITEISYEVGFNTITNFNKTFKNITGHIPRFYRKTLPQLLNLDSK